MVLGAGQRPKVAASGLILRRRRRVRKKLSNSGQSFLQAADFEIGLVDGAAANGHELGGVIALESVVSVARSSFIACLTDSAPEAAHRLMLSGPGKLHLVHGVFLAEQLSAVSTIDVAVCSTQSLPTQRVRASIMAGRALPVRFCHDIVRVQLSGFGRESARRGMSSTRRGGRRCGGRGGGMDSQARTRIRLEDIETLELLIEKGEGLELLGLFDLLLEPVLDLVLFGLL